MLPPSSTLIPRGLVLMASGNDMKAHESTYTGFLGLVKWGSILTALVTVLVVYLIA